MLSNFRRNLCLPLAQQLSATSHKTGRQNNLLFTLFLFLKELYLFYFIRVSYQATLFSNKCIIDFVVVGIEF